MAHPLIPMTMQQNHRNRRQSGSYPSGPPLPNFSAIAPPAAFGPPAPPALSNRTDTQMNKVQGNALGWSPGFQASVANSRALKKFQGGTFANLQAVGQADGEKKNRMQAYGQTQLAGADLALMAGGPQSVMQGGGGVPTAPASIMGPGFFMGRGLAADANARDNAIAGAGVRGMDEATNDVVALRPGKVASGELANAAAAEHLPYVGPMAEAQVGQVNAQSQNLIEGGNLAQSQYRDAASQLRASQQRVAQLERMLNQHQNAGARTGEGYSKTYQALKDAFPDSNIADEWLMGATGSKPPEQGAPQAAPAAPVAPTMPMLPAGVGPPTQRPTAPASIMQPSAPPTAPASIMGPAATPQATNRPLPPDIAQQILAEAGGDKQKAIQLAQQRGFNPFQ